MNYWLMKTEPGTWSWNDQVKAADRGEHWDGVRNYQASNNMKAMKLGDRCFSIIPSRKSGLSASLRSSRNIIPTTPTRKGVSGMVDVKAVRPFNQPVSLDDIKAEPRLADLALLKQSRLSVMPIDDVSWKLICQMGRTEP